MKKVKQAKTNKSETKKNDKSKDDNGPEYSPKFRFDPS